MNRRTLIVCIVTALLSSTATGGITLAVAGGNNPPKIQGVKVAIIKAGNGIKSDTIVQQVYIPDAHHPDLRHSCFLFEKDNVRNAVITAECNDATFERQLQEQGLGPGPHG